MSVFIASYKRCRRRFNILCWITIGHHIRVGYCLRSLTMCTGCWTYSNGNQKQTKKKRSKTCSETSRYTPHAVTCRVTYQHTRENRHSLNVSRLPPCLTHSFGIMQSSANSFPNSKKIINHLLQNISCFCCFNNRYHVHFHCYRRDTYNHMLYVSIISISSIHFQMCIRT